MWSRTFGGTADDRALDLQRVDNGGFAIAGNAGKTFQVANGALFQVGGTTSAFPTVFTGSLGATSTVNYSGTAAQTVAAQLPRLIAANRDGEPGVRGSKSRATNTTFDNPWNSIAVTEKPEVGMPAPAMSRSL